VLVGDKKYSNRHDNVFYYGAVIKSRATLPKERLQVLREFCSTSISRIHCDEESDAWSQPDLLSNEVEYFLFGLDGVLDALDLDSDDRQHLH